MPHLVARLAALGADALRLAIVELLVVGAAIATGIAVAEFAHRSKPGIADHTELGPDHAESKPITVDVAGFRLALSVPWARTYLATAAHHGTTVQGVTLTLTSGAVLDLDACQRAALTEQVEAGLELVERTTA